MPRGATARLFVAVDPPPAICADLAAWARAALTHADGAARVLAPGLMHVTVHFLGARPTAELGALATAVEGSAIESCTLTPGAPLWLPPRRPHALAIAIADTDGELQRLHERLARALTEASTWEPERRRFRPHVTVARMPGRRPAASGPGGEPLPVTPAGAFAPSAVRLYRSHLSPTGAEYELLAEGRAVPAGR